MKAYNSAQVLSQKDHDAAAILLLEACKLACEANHRKVMYPRLHFFWKIGQHMFIYPKSDYIEKLASIRSCTLDKTIGRLTYSHIPHIILYWAIGQHIIMYPRLDYIRQLA